MTTQFPLDWHIAQAQILNDELSLWEAVKYVFQRFVSLDDDRYYDLLTAFVFGTYIQDSVFEIAPYLQPTGTFGSGKTTLLTEYSKNFAFIHTDRQTKLRLFSFDR